MQSMSSKWTAFCLILLLVAGTEFTLRGPVRAIRSATQFNDFLSPYIQAKALIAGVDPYSPQILLKLWPAQAAHYSFLPIEVANGSLVANRGIPTAYPITSLVLIAPFTVLPWSLANALWLGINLALFLIMVCALLALAGLSYREPSAILLVAATLAVATGLKPQIGLCFLLYYLVRRRWRIFGFTLAILACVAAVGFLRLELGHTPWLENYLNDNHILLQTGVLGNFTLVNPTRFGLINLQVALYPLLGSVALANDLAISVGAGFLLVWLVVTARRSTQAGLELLDLSAIALISVLPVYHRFYDATLLVLPLCWVFISFAKERRLAILSLLLMLPFLVPGGTLLETMETSGQIPAALANRWWWEGLVMPHQVWLLLFLSVLLLCEMTTRGHWANDKSNSPNK